MSTVSPKSPARRRRRFRLRRPSIASVLWGVVSLVCLILLMVLQGTLFLIFTIVSVAFTAVSAFADFTGPEGVAGAVPVQRGHNPKTPQPRSSGRPRTSGPVVRCTVTGQPIEKCSCARRHVASQDGAQRYGKQVGDPLGTGRKP